MKVMWGIRIVPVFLTLTALSFVGTLFIEANPDVVSLHLLRYEAPPTKLGLVVLISCLVGMFATALFCSVELLALQMQNKRLRRRLMMLGGVPGPRSNVRPLKKDPPDLSPSQTSQTSAPTPKVGSLPS